MHLPYTMTTKITTPNVKKSITNSEIIYHFGVAHRGAVVYPCSVINRKGFTMQIVEIKRANGNVGRFTVPNHPATHWSKLFRDDPTIAAIDVKGWNGNPVYNVAQPGRFFACVRIDR